MKLTIKQQLNKLTKADYKTLKMLCRYSKNLMNQAIYETRQSFFNNNFLYYNDIYNILKTSYNFKMLQASIAQQALRAVKAEFNSFFAELKAKKEGRTSQDCQVNIPKYKDKSGYAPIRTSKLSITRDGYFKIPMSREFEKNIRRLE